MKRGRKKLEAPPPRAFEVLAKTKAHGRSNAAHLIGISRQAVTACLKKWFPSELEAIPHQPQPKTQPKRLSAEARAAAVKKAVEKRKENAKKRYQKRKANGVCVRCSINIKVPEGSTVCETCRAQMQQAWHKREALSAKSGSNDKGEIPT